LSNKAIQFQLIYLDQAGLAMVVGEIVSDWGFGDNILGISWGRLCPSIKLAYYIEQEFNVNPFLVGLRLFRMKINVYITDIGCKLKNPN
jgi:hypothetical protein